MHVYKYANISVFNCASMQVCQFAILKYTNMQVWKMQVYEYEIIIQVCMFC